MNKVLKLCLSNDEADTKIGEALLKRDKKLQQHFYNITLYMGPRNDMFTSKTIAKIIKEKLLCSSNFILYDAVSKYLPLHLKKKIDLEWKNTPESLLDRKCKRGRGFKEAEKSIKILSKN